VAQRSLDIRGSMCRVTFVNSLYLFIDKIISTLNRTLFNDAVNC